MDKSSAARRTQHYWTDEQTEDLRRMVAAGMSRRAIAAALNSTYGTKFSKNAVIGACARLGMTEPRRKKQFSSIVPKQKSTKAALIKLPVIVEETPPPQFIGAQNDLSPGCKFIDGEPGHTPWRCCGHPQQSGSPYCAHHTRLCNVPTPRVPKRVPILFKRAGSFITTPRVRGFA